MIVLKQFEPQISDTAWSPTGISWNAWNLQAFAVARLFYRRFKSLLEFHGMRRHFMKCRISIDAYMSTCPRWPETPHLTSQFWTSVELISKRASKIRPWNVFDNSEMWWIRMKSNLGWIFSGICSGSIFLVYIYASLAQRRASGWGQLVVIVLEVGLVRSI